MIDISEFYKLVFILSKRSRTVKPNKLLRTWGTFLVLQFLPYDHFVVY
ncbi:hypothetical protein L1282_000030 [Chryseobacterium sp. HSC-36S06]|nr:hypothetical protein [Chryseobacterium sp. HSC-36S06]